MLAVRGVFEKGRARPITSIRGREGQPVIITFLEEPAETERVAQVGSEDAWQAMTQLVESCEVRPASAISRIGTMIISITGRQRVDQMAEIFVDTVAWLALLNASDALHAPAHQIMEQLRAQQARLTTTEFVLLEVADALCLPLVRDQTIRFIEGLRRLPVLEIVPASEDLVAAGWKLYCQRNDKAWGLTDCISFAVMQERHLTQAFTSDHHFTQAGFAKLLS